MIYFRTENIRKRNSSRPENPSTVTRLPQEDMPAKAAAATTPSQTAVKPQLPVSDPNRTDPATGTTAPGTVVTSSPVAQGSSPSVGAASPKGEDPYKL